MGSSDQTSESVNFGAVQARSTDGSTAPLTALQKASSGRAGALEVKSENSAAPAVTVRGAGALLDLKNSAGTTKFSVSQTGAVASTGDQSVTGNQSVTGAFNVTGFALGEATPAAQNVAAWSYDPSLAVNAIELTGGTIYLVKMHISNDVAITKLYWWMAVAGSGTTASQNYGGLYSSAGNLLASADADATVTASAGLQTLTLASTALTAGSFVWGALVFNATAKPTVAYGAGSAGASTALNVGLTAATLRYAVNGTSQTTLPSTRTPASNSASLLAGPWMAIGV